MNETPPPADAPSPPGVAERPLVAPKVVWQSAVDPMPETFLGWSIICLLSLVLAGGLSPAMRGAFVGNEPWIVRIDLWGANASQLAAIVTMLLLVHFALTAVRVARSKLLSLGAALLACVPAIFLLLAQKHPLPHVHSWRAALCAALVLLLCSQIARARPRAKYLALLSGIALLSSSLTAAQATAASRPALSQLLLATEATCCWCAVALLVLTQVWGLRRRPVVATGILGFALLLAQTASAASLDGASTGLLLVGRAVTELSPYGTLGTAAPLALSLVLASTLASLFDQRKGDALTCSFFALGVIVPATPLVISWLSLCAFYLVVLGSTSRTEPSRPGIRSPVLNVAS